MAHPTTPPGARKAKKSEKPEKPYEGFPLFPHATGRWAKKIRGRFHYFGPWDDPDAALAKYLDERDDLHAGRTPRVKADGLTLRELLNRFLTAKQRMVDTKEMASRSFKQYHETCERVGAAFGLDRLVIDLTAEDFERLRADLAKGRNPNSLAGDVQRVRTLFKFGHDSGLIDRPVRFGPGFKKPSRKVLRAVRQAKGPRMFEAEQIRRMLDAASPQLKAMILLGINCGFGNFDCGKLPRTALDLEGGWVVFPRPKTAVERRCPLWPETVEALRNAMQVAPTPKPEAVGLVFVTRCGLCWAKDDNDNPVSKETAKLLKSLGVHRKGLNFYALRHGFETIGGESRDQVAVDHVMGHARDDMASAYREHISDERLKAVTDHVRAWLFPPEIAAPEKDSPEKGAAPKKRPSSRG